MGRTAEQRDMKRGDQIREEQAGAAETGSIRVLGKNLSIPTSASLSRSMCVRIPSSVASERAYKVVKNVVGDTRRRLRP